MGKHPAQRGSPHRLGGITQVQGRLEQIGRPGGRGLLPKAAYVHTYVRTSIHTYIRTYVHTHTMHTHTRKYIHTYIHTHVDTSIHTYIRRSCIHTHSPAYISTSGAERCPASTGPDDVRKASVPPPLASLGVATAALDPGKVGSGELRAGRRRVVDSADRTQVVKFTLLTTRAGGVEPCTRPTDTSLPCRRRGRRR